MFFQKKRSKNQRTNREYCERHFYVGDIRCPECEEEFRIFIREGGALSRENYINEIRSIRSELYEANNKIEVGYYKERRFQEEVRQSKIRISELEKLRLNDKRQAEKIKALQSELLSFRSEPTNSRDSYIKGQQLYLKDGRVELVAFVKKGANFIIVANLVGQQQIIQPCDYHKLSTIPNGV
jgi:hypothetical protein